MATVSAYPAAASCGLIPFAFPHVPGVRCCFGTALYGNISLDFNLHSEADILRRHKLRELMGFEYWSELKQVHGDTLIPDPAPTGADAPSSLAGDAMSTCRTGHALLIKAADCQQILLAHISGRYVAAIHCGWRGNALNFPITAVRRFCSIYALQPDDIMAVRGPSLGPGAAQFINFHDEWPSEFGAWFDAERQMMDLWSLTRYQLELAGLQPQNIFSIDLCTHSLDTLFFSHRSGHFGRQGAVIFIAQE